MGPARGTRLAATGCLRSSAIRLVPMNAGGILPLGGRLPILDGQRPHFGGASADLSGAASATDGSAHAMARLKRSPTGVETPSATTEHRGTRFQEVIR